MAVLKRRMRPGWVELGTGSELRSPMLLLRCRQTAVKFVIPSGARASPLPAASSSPPMICQRTARCRRVAFGIIGATATAASEVQIGAVGAGGWLLGGRLGGPLQLPVPASDAASACITIPQHENGGKPQHGPIAAAPAQPSAQPSACAPPLPPCYSLLQSAVQYASPEIPKHAETHTVLPWWL